MTDPDGNKDTDTVTITVTHQATVSSFAISSAAGFTRANTYVQGEDIDVTVQFSETVNVTGTPRLPLTIGSATRYANYASGTRTDTLTFTYTVASGDSDDNGVSIDANSLEFNSGTINDASGLAADLDHSESPPVPATKWMAA